MIANLVSVHVKPEAVEAFKEITAYNHENTRREPGNVRFDVLWDKADPTRFTLYEVFADEDAVAYHKTTEHYNRWREAVAPYMAEPRTAVSTTPLCFD
ncbi:MAG: antibiotic biosynthesis monooxygenase [Clostridia bacterium]|nr:antibiotic biosynthesis monooxygenase [Clostridia bacterium]